MLRRLVPLTVLVAFAMGVLPIAAPVDDPLAQGFETPPDSAKPRVWWHWMNGNITREGITRDLEWMHRIGIGGFQNFDAALAPVKVVDTRIVYMTPEWKEAFRYAIELADRLGLETAIAGSPGWSESGGPWVQPAQGMKKLVWSETRLRGGAPFHARLAKPPSTTGPFQNARLIDPGDARMGLTPAPPPELYRDTVVIAYRVPDGDVAFADLKPTVTSSGGAIDVAGLSDGDVENFSALPKAPVGERAWVQIEFSRPQTIRGATLALAGYIWPYGPRPEGPDLESSADGQSFTKVVNIPMTLSPETTVSFAPVTAPIFRLSFRTPPPETGASPLRLPPPPTHQIAEFVLHTGARVHRFEEKAAFATMPDLSTVPTAAVASRDSVKKADVIDLTARMKPDGTLHWMPPPGQWVVLRFGYSLLGIKNHPASPEGTGLEVDKLSAEHVKAYMRTYLDSYQSALGSLMGKRGLQYLISDSWEARAQNWTENVLQEFARRRGYDAHPWLPALTGRVIDSAEASDRFLWDFRRTLSDMVAEYHYDQITAILKARGMGHYGESHEGGRAFIGDGMEVKRSNDVPMAAMWTQLPGVNTEQYGYNADIRESASVAHLYGQNLVAAESLTARSGAWAWSPATLKPTADKELALGLNRFVIHTSVHQPLVDKGPGLSLGPYGQWFTRNETWAEQAKAWITYLARCSYMLQQGRFVADVLYFYGEDSNLTALFAGRAPAVPAGYNFDYVNADALVHVLTVKDGNLATPSGMRYRVLVIDPRARQMSLPVLRKLRDLVMAGANIVGPKPAGSPSLSDDDATFAHLADELWGSGDASEERTAGKGRVFGDMPIADALAHLAVTPDVEYAKTKPDSQLLFVHRSLPDGEAYFVNNRNDHDETVDVTFRVAGKSPELWHPDSGLREPVGFQIVNGRTTVHLHLEPWDTVFVVFRKDTTETRRPDPLLISRTLSTLDGAWSVSFQADRGAPDTITLPMLASWSDNTNPGVKYFSGTGTYTRSLDAPADWFRPDPPGTPATQLWLDLGDVRELAEVSINGTPLGIIWKRPYRVNATGFLKPGANAVVIKVTNLWVNRMIGDQQPHAARQDTFTVPTFYKADSPLVPSGMLGPVTVRQVMAH